MLFKKILKSLSVGFYILLFTSNLYGEIPTQTYTIGQINDVLTVNEGEMLDFSLLPPSDFGPDVQWTVTGLPDDRAFYDVPAFPGAEGFGARASGGRGGKVVKVTNLDREGPGSLAEALMMDEPRIIVFDVSGVIKGPKPAGGWMIPKSARLYTENAPVTIAAQTAPGAGITIEGQLSLTTGDGGEGTDNAVVRFLRIRTPYHRNGVGDCISAYGSNTILDHVSGAWGNDENFDLSNLDHGTVQWCGIEESAGYGELWEVYIDKDEDGMYDFWEAKVLDFSTTDDVDDYILDVVADEDLDGDGTTNIEEYNNGTNPLVANAAYDPDWDPGYDSDHDGLLDWWEQQVIDADATDDINDLTDIRPEDDLDGDLASNKEEHDNGTTPIEKPTHNYGMIVGYDAVNLSTHHNFFAHHSRRAPLSGVEVLDHRNNVIYNFSTAGLFHPAEMNRYRPGELFKTNYVHNYYKAGPNDPKLNDTTVWVAPWIEIGRSLIYDGGSYFDMYDDPSGYLDIFGNSARTGLTTLTNADEYCVQNEYPAVWVTTQTAETAYGLVLAHAGTLPKDAVTQKNIQEIKDRTGHWGKKMPTGGLMEGLSPGTASLDSDNDGMPDTWENAHGLNPNDATDASMIVKHGKSVLTYDGSDVQGTEDRYKGYTYIEYYINEIADQLILTELLANGYDHTNLPGYGIAVKPTVNWTPGYKEAGTYPITITATDGNQTITEQVTITVQDQNRAPYIYSAMYKEDGTSMSGHQTNFVEVGQRLYFEFYAGDIDELVDGDTYTVEFINAPDGYISRDTGITRNLKGSTVFHVHSFEWIPAPEDVGSRNTVEIKLTDSHGRSYSQSFILEVSEADVPIHKIDAGAGDHGTISPSGIVYVQDGDSRTFTITPDDGYVVSDILIDGVSTGIQHVNTYILEGITSDYTIQPIFAYDPESINGVILDMKFNGNMNDDSGLGNHGSASGESQPTLTADRYGSPGKAYYFDGVDDYIDVMDSDYFSTPVFTIAAWVYSNKDWYSSSYIVSKNKTGGTNTISMYNKWDNLYTCGTGYPRVERILNDHENEWLHLVIVRNLTSTDFYMNGIYQGSYESVPGKDNDYNLLIGAKTGPAEFFNGIIDEVKIWSWALTAEQIAGITDYSIVTQPVPICTEFTYSDWGECQPGGTRSRTVVNSLPEGCSGGNPDLTESCSYTALCGDNVCSEGETCLSCPNDCGVCLACTENDWSYSDGECGTDGIFVRTWTKTNTSCDGGITHPTTEIVSCAGEIPIADEDTDADGVVNFLVEIRKDCSTALGACYNSLSDFQSEYLEKDLVASNKEIDIKCYNDWPEGLSDSFVLEGWTTDADHHLNIYTPSSERHNGMVKDTNGDYTGFAIEATDSIRIHADYTVLDGIIFNLMGNGSHVELGAWQKGGKKSVFRNNIACNARYRHLYLGDYQQIKVYNNFIINENWSYSSYGAIDCGPVNDQYYHEIYNNSIYTDGNFWGIVGSNAHDGLRIENNLCYTTGTTAECFKNVDPDYFSNNISSDDTGNLFDMTLDDIKFTSTAAEQVDLHLQPDSVAASSGLDLSSVFSEDIDGEIRDNWSIGADDPLELESGIGYTALCGDNVCGEGETCLSCPNDCGVCLACTESDWSYSDGECRTDGTFVRTWTKTNTNCDGGITHPATETVACTGDIPIAAFTVDQASGITPLTVNFSDLSTNNPTSWFWNFKGGTPSTSTSQNPSIVYNDAGIYSVSLLVGNDSGEDMETKEHVITVEASDVTGGYPDEDTDADGVVNCLVEIRRDCSTAQGYCYNSLSDFQSEYLEKDLVGSNKEIDIKCYNDWPEGLSDSFILEGWTTDADHHLNIYTPSSERHNGMVKDVNGDYTGFAIEATNSIRIRTDYTVVDGIIFNLMGNGSHVELGCWQKGGKQSVFKNNIAYNASYRHVYLGDYQQIQVYNNFFINENSSYSAYGAIDCGPTNDRYYHEIYNNSIYIDGNFSGIVGGKYHDGLTITNNLCYKSGTATECFTNIDPDYFLNNISSDATGNLFYMTLDDIRFTATAAEQVDLHLQPDSVAAGSGLDLSSEFSEDIDGEIRDNWSIGGDDLLLD